MEGKTENTGVYRLLGAAFLVQSVTPLIVGSWFDSLEVKDSIQETMRAIARHATGVGCTVFAQFVTAIFIIILGVAMYQAVRHIHKTRGLIALTLYALEAVLLVIGQVFVMGLLKVSSMYAAGGVAELIPLASVLLYCKHFALNIAMLPFGIGALLFYSMLGKAQVFPKWLTIWGVASAPLILIVIPLSAFGVLLPFALCFPYVPFEFVAGGYMLIRYRKTSTNPFLS